MNEVNSSSNSVTSYYDLVSLGNLKSQTESSETIRQVAEQFESVFVNMVLKAGRDAAVSDGIFSSANMRTYEEMFDHQVSMEISRGGGIGLADLIETQLSMSRQMSDEADSDA